MVTDFAGLLALEAQRPAGGVAAASCGWCSCAWCSAPLESAMVLLGMSIVKRVPCSQEGQCGELQPGELRTRCCF